MAELKLDLSRVDQGITDEAGGGEEEGEGEGEGVDPLSEFYAMEEQLPPLEKLERYFQSEERMDRELAVHCIVEAVEVAASYSEYQLILEIALTLANDHEPTIRMSILDTVMVLLEHHGRLANGDAENSLESEERLLDVPIRMLADINQTVRKTSQNCVVVLLEEERGNRNVLIGQLLPEMVRCLSRDENYDLRMDMASLVSRLAPLFGKPILVKYFLPLFPSLGCDAMFHVRKAFALGCRDMCSVLGEEITEQHILPIFLKLCKDDVWGVRKACTDVFADVSNCCNLGTRHDTLTPSYLSLLHDESRWVRKAAFQHLGTFIATFYVPSESGATSVCDDSSLDPLGDSVLMDNSLLPTSLSPQPGKEEKEEEEEAGEVSQPSSGDSNSSAPLHKRDSGRAGEAEEEEEEGEGVKPSESPEELLKIGRLKLKEEEEEESGGGSGGGDLPNEGVAPVNHQLVEKLNFVEEWRQKGMTEIESCSHGVREKEEGEDVNMEERAVKEGQKDVEMEGDKKEEEEEKEEEDEDEEEEEEKEKKEKEEEEEDVAKKDGEVQGEKEVVNSSTSEAMSSEEGTQELVANQRVEEASKMEEGRVEISHGQLMADQLKTVEGGRGEGEAEEEGERDEGSLEGGSQEQVKEEEEEEKVRETKGEEEVGVEEKEVRREEEEEVQGEVKGEEVEVTVGEVKGEEEVEVTVGEVTIEEGEPGGEVRGEGERGGEVRVGGEKAAETDAGRISDMRRTDSGSDPGQSREEEQYLQERGEEGEGEGDPGARGEGEGGTGVDKEEEEGVWPWSEARQCPVPQSFPPVRLLLHTTTGHVTEPECPEEPPSFHDNNMSVTMDLTLANTSDINPNLDLTLGQSNPSSLEQPPQEIVPDELMDLYLSMTDVTKAQTIDSDLPYYCAYCLPGVLQALGKENWPLLKMTFDALSGDMQWKIRRVLAYSLHELARILGTEATVADLYPTFEEYCTKDIDDVKIGVLSHLVDFFEILPSSLRHSHLPTILSGLLDVENEKNWRYRNTFVEQLIALCDLYDADYLYSQIYPLARQLAEDKVAHIRHAASQLLGVILHRLTQITPDGFLPLLRELKADYATHSRWSFRLLYIKQCEIFLTEGCISCEVFVSECLPSLLSLTADKVPNVRLALGKMVKDTLMSIDYFQTDGKDSLEKLQSTLSTLQSDPDRDVKYFSGGGISSLRRTSQFNLRDRSYSQTSEDQYQDAMESFDGEGREQEPWLMVNFDTNPLGHGVSIPFHTS